MMGATAGGWPLCQLSEVADIIPGLSQKEIDLDSPEYALVSIGNLDGGVISARSDLPLVGVNLRGARQSRPFLESGDVVVTAVGASWKSALVREEYVGAVPSHTLFIVRPRRQLAWGYLFACLRAPRVVALMQGVARGSTRTLSWRRSDLASILVPVPPVEQQSKLTELLFAGEDLYRRSIEAADLRREAVLGLVDHVLYGARGPES